MKFHFFQIKDPYRWLEDPDSEETKQFVEAQNAISFPYLNGCPAKSKIQSKLTEMWDYPKYSVPFREGNRYFYFMNTGVQNQSVLYVQDGLNEPARIFFDPNELSTDGKFVLHRRMAQIYFILNQDDNCCVVTIS
jgi:prolyl oligopeptidase